MENTVGDVHAQLDAAKARVAWLEEMFLQSQKMDALGQLSSGVVHDFNNLLQVIIGHTEMLMMDAETQPAETRDSLNEIRKAATRAADLTHQLLSFSRKQAVQLKPGSLNDAIRDLVKLLKRMLGDTIILKCRLADEMPRMDFDLTQLTQIITNLVINARDAMNGEGTLTLETFTMRIDQDDVAHCRLSCEPGLYVGFSVSDNGCGMPKEVQERIFEPFFTTKQLGAGSGLGLSTVFELVKQLHGGIDLESAPNVGTTFRVFFPAADPYEKVPLNVTAGDYKMPHDSGRILLVDDRPSLVAFNTRMLERAGYDVVATCDPQEAIRIVERSDDFDLLFSDVMIPKLNGWDMYQQMLKTHPKLQALFISGYVPKQLEIQLTTNAHFLYKPCPVQKILEEIEAIIATAR